VPHPLRPLAAALCAAALAAPGCDLLTPPDKGTFNLMNDTEATLTILVSENEQCVIGLHSDVPTHTWRNYDIEKRAEGAWLCIQGGKHKVADGKSYRFGPSGLQESEAP